MKTLLIAIVAMLTAKTILSQQNPVWNIPANLFDPIGVGLSPLPIPTTTAGLGYSGQTSDYASNAIYDNYGELVFFIVDSKLYDDEGYLIDDLSDYGGQYAISGVREVAVVPNPRNCRQYFIFTSKHDVSASVDQNVLPVAALVDLDAQNIWHPSRSGALINLGNSPIFELEQLISYGYRAETSSTFAIAVSPKTNDGGHLILLSRPKVDANGADNADVVVLKLSASGAISYQNAIELYGNLLEFEREEYGYTIEMIPLSNGNYRVAFPARYYPNGGGGIGEWSVAFCDIDQLGNVIAGTEGHVDYQLTGLPQGTAITHTDMEFSPNGEYLYITHTKQTGAPVINETVEVYDFNNQTLSPLSLTAGEKELLKNSYMEVGLDGKLYFAHANGLAALADANNPSSAFNMSAVQFTYAPSYSVPTTGNNAHLAKYVLPDQIDGFDYLDHFTASTECCRASRSFSIEAGNPYTVTNNASWSGTLPSSIPFTTYGGDIYCDDNITVNAGVVLDITNLTIHFTPDAHLIIEPGAKVVCNNSILTSDDRCGVPEMWPGVELRGNSGLTQIPTSNQGYMQMLSSTISNAYIGISVYGKDVSGNILWNQTGGLIKANNSIFLNNKRDVEYLSYIPQNYSVYQNCQFLTDAALNDGTPPNTHVSMYRINNVKFFGCDFRNTTSGLYADDNRGTGIRTVDAKYTVAFRCTSIQPIGVPCPDPDKDGCVFENLFRGIYSTSSNNFYTANIRYNDFINNTYGIYFGGVDYSYVVNNNINVGTPFPVSYGLHLDNCTGYAVENNSFDTPFNTSTYGTITVNSNGNGLSPDNNVIYNNSFDGFMYANIAALNNVQLDPNNGNPIANTGLQYICNDIKNSSQLDIGTTLGGVSIYQGAPCGIPDAQANNDFSVVPSTIGDFWNANSTTTGLLNTYLYEAGGNREPRPNYYNATNTAVQGCNNGWNPIEACPVNKFDQPKVVLQQHIANYRNEAESLNTQIDGGDTDNLLSAINSNMSNGQLKNLLLANSPYLSDEVLLAMLNSNLSLPNGHIKQILLANSPLSQDVMDAINNQNLPNGIMNQINAAQNGSMSAMEELKASISYYKSESDLFQNALIRYFLNDSTEVYGEDSVVVILKNDNRELNNKCRLAALYIKKQDFVNATSLLDSMDNSQTTDHSEFCEYQKLILSLEQTLKACYTLEDDPIKKNQIEQIANQNDNSKRCVHASSILKQIFNHPYQEYIPFLSVTKSMAITNDPNHGKNTKFFSLYPNPSSGIVNIDLDLIKGDQAQLVVLDLSGKVVEIKDINTSFQTLDVSNYASGVYLIKITSSFGLSQISKLIVE